MFGVIAAGAAVTGCFGFFAHRSFRFRMRQERYGRFMDSGQGRRALPELRQLVKRHSSDLMLRYFLGQAYLQAGLGREAAQELELVDTRNRSEKLISPIGLTGLLARAYEELGRYKEAQGVLLLQLKNFPMAFELLVQVAEIFQRRGMPRHASEYMEMALRIDPDNTALILRMSSFLEHSGDLKGALKQPTGAGAPGKGPEACRIAAGFIQSFQLSARPGILRILAGRGNR
jgi:tetratricopeptide (TPR) repeat protein